MTREENIRIVNEKGRPYRFGTPETGIDPVAAGRNAGIRSGEVRREKKLFREKILQRMKEEDFNAIVDGMIERAKTGRQAAADLADRIDGKPTETHENTTELTADVAIDAEAIRAEIWKRLQEEI